MEEALWRGYICCRLWERKKRRAEPAREEKRELLQAQRRFCCQMEQVEKACAFWEEEKPGTLAGQYMAHVLSHQKQKEWWAENGEFLDQPWFIRRYCLDYHLADSTAAFQPPPLPLHLIRPEKTLRGWIAIKMDRNPEAPQTGRILAECAYEKETWDCLKKLHFSRTHQGYCCFIDECFSPIEERAAEYAAALLRQGYGVAVAEEKLKQRVLAGHFRPAHGHWIRETEHPELLQLIYPYDKTLHRYLCLLGARWENKRMLLPIHCAERLPDIIRLYGFRLTTEARRRLDVWEAAQAKAVVYRPRRKRQEAPASSRDLFLEMLKDPPRLLPDLEDPE